MKKYAFLLLLVIISSSLLLSACSSKNSDSKDLDAQSTGKTDSKNAVKTKGGEKLLSVRAEYTYCYATPENYDPTAAFECDSEITYKQCLEWKEKEEGEAHTFFYAVFEGGEATIPGRYANNYYMKVKYGTNLEQKTDTSAAFPERETEFKAYDLTDCYPKGSLEIYDVEDKLMGSMSFDYTND